MNLCIETLTPALGARVTGVDLRRPVDAGTYAAISAALDAHGVLVLPEQPLDDDRQIAFSRLFGPLERTAGTNPAAGTVFARQSNLDIRNGETIPADDRRMHYQKSNYLWHADSTFKAIPSRCSLLSARVVPPEGGATEFASTRAAYDSLTAGEQAALEDLIVEHDFIYSRGLTGFSFDEAERALYPPVRHRLVRVNPATGRRAVMIGAHARTIVGWSEAKARALLDDLLARATRSEHCYRHEWRQGDLLIWDNQAVLHRATPYDAARHRRLMQRTTVSAGTVANRPEDAALEPAG